MSGQIFTGHCCFSHCFIILVLSINLFAFSPVQTTPTPLTGAEPATGFFQISPDSQYVVYAANAAIGDGFLQLYSVPLGGGAPVQLNLSLPEERIFDYAISSDGRRVVYQLGADLYGVPIAGPANASVRLNQATLVGNMQHKFSISPDGRHVVYRTTDDLYSVPIDGPAGASVKVNLALLAPAPGSSGAIATDFAISPDSQHVLYVAHTGLFAFDLYSVPIGGPASASVLLSSAGAPSEPGADIDWFIVSSDSQRVVYGSDKDVDTIFELYSAPVAGPAGNSVKLNVPLDEYESVYGVSVSADSLHVVYAKGDELYSTPIAGPADASVRLNTRQTPVHVDSAVQISADSQWVVFQAGDLYRTPLNGPANALERLTDMMAEGRGVAEFRISLDSRRVVYSGYETVTSPVELYSVPVEGPIDASVKLNRPLASIEHPLFFEITPDGQSVVYEARQDAAGKNELYGAPVAGPASVGVKLNSALQGPGVWPLHWQISKDSDWVVYVAGSDIYAAALDTLSWTNGDETVQQLESWYTYLPIMPR